MDVIDHDGMMVAGLLVQAPFQQLREEVPKAWEQLFALVSGHEKLATGTFVDVCLGVMDTDYLQLVGLPFDSTVDIPDSLTAVHIPMQWMLHHRHNGPVTAIANSFGDMYSWGDRNQLKLGELKLDIGYSRDGAETEHDLYIGLLPDTPWRYIGPAKKPMASTR